MTALKIISYTGIYIFALTGALKARTFKMDVFGGIVLAFATAYGGGTVRDMFIGAQRVNWVNDNIALLLVLAGTGITFLLKQNVHRFRATLFYTDAIGLGLFTTTGIEVSLQNGVNQPYALVMGVITATFGGLVADVLCSSIPTLLKRGELYATASAIGGALYILLKHTIVPHNTNLVICIVTVTAIRVYSKRKRLTLPEI
ncbi:trimeric intracellular cation channel family protein [Parasediminibacterium sp. JCM 36343]|uniref:trimeric intracellular cation channel family protein n=1 Tax=Parasediminibacterium sp. JCM 36343 TaxID=3374279 RepID=UPI00397D51EA